MISLGEGTHPAAPFALARPLLIQSFRNSSTLSVSYTSFAGFTWRKNRSFGDM